MNTLSKRNKTALVTGASSGIGLALVKRLLLEGYKVIGTTRSGKFEGIKHDKLQILPLELTLTVSVEEISEKLSKQFKIDLLINNAGIAPDVFEIKPNVTDFNETIQTNLSGTVFFTESVLERINQGGKIIFISSDMGLTENAGPTGTAYRISKAAINMYAGILAKRLEERNIAVVPVHPGWVKTKLGGAEALLSADESAERIVRSLKKLETGKFFNTDTLG